MRTNNIIFAATAKSTEYFNVFLFYIYFLLSFRNSFHEVSADDDDDDYKFATEWE